MEEPLGSSLERIRGIEDPVERARAISSLINEAIHQGDYEAYELWDRELKDVQARASILQKAKIKAVIVTGGQPDHFRKVHDMKVAHDEGKQARRLEAIQEARRQEPIQPEIYQAADAEFAARIEKSAAAGLRFSSDELDRLKDKIRSEFVQSEVAKVVGAKVDAAKDLGLDVSDQQEEQWAREVRQGLGLPAQAEAPARSQERTELGAPSGSPAGSGVGAAGNAPYGLRNPAPGFTQDQLDAEREMIIAQMSKSSWGSRTPQVEMDANTRARALMRGRLATHDEIKRGRREFSGMTNKQRYKKLDGLRALGIVLS